MYCPSSFVSSRYATFDGMGIGTYDMGIVQKG